KPSICFKTKISGEPSVRERSWHLVRRRGSSVLSHPPNTLVPKAMRSDFFRSIDIAQINQHWISHCLLQASEIKSAELFPFRHDHQGVSAFCTVVGPIAICHVR